MFREQRQKWISAVALSYTCGKYTMAMSLHVLRNSFGQHLRTAVSKCHCRKPDLLNRKKDSSSFAFGKINIISWVHASLYAYLWKLILSAQWRWNKWGWTSVCKNTYVIYYWCRQQPWNPKTKNVCKREMKIVLIWMYQLDFYHAPPLLFLTACDHQSIIITDLLITTASRAQRKHGES